MDDLEILQSFCEAASGSSSATSRRDSLTPS